MSDKNENEIPNLTPRLGEKGIAIRFEDVDTIKIGDAELASKIANVLLAKFVIQEHDKTAGVLEPVSLESLCKTLERVLSEDFGFNFLNESDRLFCLKDNSEEQNPALKQAEFVYYNKPERDSVYSSRKQNILSPSQMLDETMFSTIAKKWLYEIILAPFILKSKFFIINVSEKTDRIVKTIDYLTHDEVILCLEHLLPERTGPISIELYEYSTESKFLPEIGDPVDSSSIIADFRPVTQSLIESIESLILLDKAPLTENQIRVNAFTELMSKYGGLIVSLKTTGVKHITCYNDGHYYVIDQSNEKVDTLICSTNPYYSKGQMISVSDILRK